MAQQLVAQVDALVAALDGGDSSATLATETLADEQPLVHALLVGASPRDALLALRRVLVAAPAALDCVEADAAHVQTLTRVLSSGPSLARMLARHPDRVALLLSPDLGRPLPREALAEELAYSLDEARAEHGALSDQIVAETITRLRDDHFVRLAACEFGDTPLEQVGRELSDLADVCLDAALRHALADEARKHGPPRHTDADGEEQPTGLAVIAMGKYGARELNFCSDIDIIYIYSSDSGAAGERSLHEYFAAVCQRCTRILSQRNAEGMAFRVDLRLRPEGEQGPICNSLASAERYYETFGGPYDRLAWLKARPCAGDLELGAELVSILRPMVFPRSVDATIVGDIAELVSRIRAGLRENSGVTPGFDVKLGRGGIRDVEFFIQALQLVHAGKQPALREPSTLRALDKLLFAGLISDRERETLAEGYDLLRRIEHRLQLHAGNQTHLLPHDGSLRAHVMAHLEYEPDAFAEALERHREAVAEIFATLVAPSDAPAEALSRRDGGDGDIEPSEEEALGALLDPHTSDVLAAAALGELGFAQPAQALSHLRSLQSKPWGPLGRAPSASARRVARPLLRGVVSSPDPDATLLHLVGLSQRFGAHDSLWRLLDDNPDALRLLCSLFGSSDYLARLLIGNPAYVDRLVLGGQVAAPRDAAVLRERLDRVIAPVRDDYEAAVAAISKAQAGELLRIGFTDIAGGAEPGEVWAQLSALADAVVGELLALVWSQMARRYGQPRGEDGQAGRLAVMALGKLGARELTYGSDLDLIFVYDGAGDSDGARQLSAGEYFTRLAQRLVNALGTRTGSGQLYAVDTRLRPSGNQGTLVASQAAFVEHHRGSAETWQRQVLLKLRFVAGDRALGEELVQKTRERMLDRAVDAAERERLRADVREMRLRIERELAEEKGDFYNLKLGRGGLLDIEFVAQYLQLGFAAREPNLRRRSTIDALEGAVAAGVLDGELASTLLDGYGFLRRVESRLRIVRDRSAERLPRQILALELIARRLGYRARPEGDTQSPGAQLLEHYRERTAAIRAAFEQVLGSSDGEGDVQREGDGRGEGEGQGEGDGRRAAEEGSE